MGSPIKLLAGLVALLVCIWLFLEKSDLEFPRAKSSDEEMK